MATRNGKKSTGRALSGRAGIRPWRSKAILAAGAGVPLGLAFSADPATALADFDGAINDATFDDAPMGEGFGVDHAANNSSRGDDFGSSSDRAEPASSYDFTEPGFDIDLDPPTNFVSLRSANGYENIGGDLGADRQETLADQPVDPVLASLEHGYEPDNANLGAAQVRTSEASSIEVSISDVSDVELPAVGGVGPAEMMAGGVAATAGGLSLTAIRPPHPTAVRPPPAGVAANQPMHGTKNLVKSAATKPVNLAKPAATSARAARSRLLRTAVTKIPVVGTYATAGYVIFETGLALGEGINIAADYLRRPDTSTNTNTNTKPETVVDIPTQPLPVGTILWNEGLSQATSENGAWSNDEPSPLLTTIDTPNPDQLTTTIDTNTAKPPAQETYTPRVPYTQPNPDEADNPASQPQTAPTHSEPHPEHNAPELAPDADPTPDHAFPIFNPEPPAETYTNPALPKFYPQPIRLPDPIVPPDSEPPSEQQTFNLPPTVSNSAETPEEDPSKGTKPEPNGETEPEPDGDSTPRSADATAKPESEALKSVLAAAQAAADAGKPRGAPFAAVLYAALDAARRTATQYTPEASSKPTEIEPTPAQRVASSRHHLRRVHTAELARSVPNLEAIVEAANAVARDERQLSPEEQRQWLRDQRRIVVTQISRLNNQRKQTLNSKPVNLREDGASVDDGAAESAALQEIAERLEIQSQELARIDAGLAVFDAAEARALEVSEAEAARRTAEVLSHARADSSLEAQADILQGAVTETQEALRLVDKALEDGAALPLTINHFMHSVLHQARLERELTYLLDPESETTRDDTQQSSDERAANTEAVAEAKTVVEKERTAQQQVANPSLNRISETVRALTTAEAQLAPRERWQIIEEQRKTASAAASRLQSELARLGNQPDLRAPEPGTDNLFGRPNDYAPTPEIEQASATTREARQALDQAISGGELAAGHIVTFAHERLRLARLVADQNREVLPGHDELTEEALAKAIRDVVKTRRIMSRNISDLAYADNPELNTLVQATDNVAVAEAALPEPDRRTFLHEQLELAWGRIDWIQKSLNSLKKGQSTPELVQHIENVRLRLSAEQAQVEKTRDEIQIFVSAEDARQNAELAAAATAAARLTPITDDHRASSSEIAPGQDPDVGELGTSSNQEPASDLTAAPDAEPYAPADSEWPDAEWIEKYELPQRRVLTQSGQDALAEQAEAKVDRLLAEITKIEEDQALIDYEPLHWAPGSVGEVDSEADVPPDSEVEESQALHQVLHSAQKAVSELAAAADAEPDALPDAKYPDGAWIEKYELPQDRGLTSSERFAQAEELAGEYLARAVIKKRALDTARQAFADAKEDVPNEPGPERNAAVIRRGKAERSVRIADTAYKESLRVLTTALWDSYY